MTLKPYKHVLIACMFALVPLADQALADPVNVPGMQRNQPGEYPIGVNDRLSCGSTATTIWHLLFSHEDRMEIGNGLDNHFGRPSAGGKTYSGIGSEWGIDSGDLVTENRRKIHQRVSKIDSRQHPDAVLRFHIAQHLAEECVLANGEDSPYRNETGKLVTYDGIGDQPLRTGRCADVNTTRAAMLDCADKAIDAINARHDWNVSFQRNE